MTMNTIPRQILSLLTITIAIMSVGCGARALPEGQRREGYTNKVIDEKAYTALYGQVYKFEILRDNEFTKHPMATELNRAAAMHVADRLELDTYGAQKSLDTAREFRKKTWVHRWTVEVSFDTRMKEFTELTSAEAQEDLKKKLTEFFTYYPNRVIQEDPKAMLRVRGDIMNQAGDHRGLSTSLPGKTNIEVGSNGFLFPMVDEIIRAWQAEHHAPYQDDYLPVLRTWCWTEFIEQPQVPEYVDRWKLADGPRFRFINLTGYAGK